MEVCTAKPDPSATSSHFLDIEAAEEDSPELPNFCKGVKDCIISIEVVLAFFEVSEEIFLNDAEENLDTSEHLEASLTLDGKHSASEENNNGAVSTPAPVVVVSIISDLSTISSDVVFN